jgi:DHA2 family multidrug resistance protein
MALFGVSVMVGPVLGPVIGGWLTEKYQLALGVLHQRADRRAGLCRRIDLRQETKRTSQAKLDWFGFGMLSLAIASLQLFLDRGEQLDWFSSGEIMIEAIVCARPSILIVHTFTAKILRQSALFLDRNFSVSMIFIFVVGITYLASLALMTPYLQTLMGYPVVTAGIVMGPRGLGTMVCMFLVGRLIGKVDTRLLLVLGLAVTPGRCTT